MAFADKLISTPIRHPRVVALAILVAVCVAGFGVCKLHFSVDLLGGNAPTLQMTVAVPNDTAPDEVNVLLLEMNDLDGILSVHELAVPESLRESLPDHLLNIFDDLIFEQAQSRDHRILVATVPDDEHSVVAAAQLQDTVQRVLSRPDRAVVVGVPILRQGLENATRTDHEKLVPIVLIVFIVILGAAFRRVWAMLFPLLAISVSAWLVAGLVGFLGIALGGPSTVVIPLVMVLGLADSVHFVVRFSENRRSRPVEVALQATLEEVGFACLLTTLTTSGGFLALTLVGSSTLRTFGALAAGALLLALLVALTVPATLISLRRPSRLLPFRDPGRFLQAFWEKVQNRRRWVFGGLILAAVLSVVPAMMLHPNFNYSQVLPSGDPIARAHRIADEDLGGLFALNIEVDVTDPSNASDRAVFADLIVLHRFLERAPAVGMLLSPVTVMDATNQPMGRSSEEVIAETALPTLAERRYQRAWHTAQMAADVFLPTSIWDGDSGRFFFRMRLHDVGSAAWESLVDDVVALDRRDLPHISVTATGPVMVAVGHQRVMLSELWQTIGLIACFASLLVAFAFRSIRVGFLLLLPLALTATATLAVMVWWGVPVGQTNFFVLAAGLGVGVDAMVHLITRLRQESGKEDQLPRALANTMRTAGRAVVLGHCLMLAGVIILAQSVFPSIRESALVLLAALAVNLVVTFLTFVVGAQWLVAEEK